MRSRSRGRPVDLTRMIASSNDLCGTTADLITFHRALPAGVLFDAPRTAGLLAGRRNRLRNVPVLRYGLGTMIFRINRLIRLGGRPLALTGHSGVTGTWLFHCPELDVHLAGTVDRTGGRAVPFRIMAACLNLWRL
jgi:D-alanyl-D-alanine carboxypeptidase